VHTAESLRALYPGRWRYLPLSTAAIVSPRRWVETHQQGADWIVRWNSAMPLWTPKGEEFDLGDDVERNCRRPQAIVTRAVQVGPAGHRPRWRVAARLSALPESAGQ